METLAEWVKSPPDQYVFVPPPVTIISTGVRFSEKMPKALTGTPIVSFSANRVKGITPSSPIVMALLARSKRKVATALGSAAMRADARQTDFCTYLSAILLSGLLLNELLGWRWADPIAALIMVPIIANEGIGALRGKSCSDECGCQC